uniref:Uncharacterized protein n=1 Tax=Sinocyclocheilus grahami TaxID=75366 RepID=A0A672KBU2_SINGR
MCLCCSERIGMRQSQVDKLYAGLKDLSEERRGKLEERFRLFQLNREVDDLEQWIKLNKAFIIDKSYKYLSP